MIWEVYDPAAPHGEIGNTRRSIAAANDGGRWVFEQFGPHFPIEKTKRYEARKKRDRFDRELLSEYIAHFGISCIGDALFEPVQERPGILCLQPYWDHVKQFSLEEVCAGVPWNR